MTETGGDSGNTPAEVIALVNDGLVREDLVTLAGHCTVRYDGRTSRRFGPADRLVICKPDGATVVHEATGLQPVAYAQPDGTIEISAEDGVLVQAERDDPPESLEIAFEEVPRVDVLAVETASAVGDAGPEARLRERILDEPELLEPGFRPLATERETSAGPVDVFGRDARGRTVIVEVKARRVGPDAVGQLSRYVISLEEDLHADAAIRGVLAAPGVTERARELLAEQGLEFVPLSVG